MESIPDDTTPGGFPLVADTKVGNVQRYSVLACMSS